MIGLVLLALAIGTAAYRTTTATQILSPPTPQRDTSANDFGVRFGTEVEERMVRVDLRIPAVFGIIGVGMIASAFIHRRN